MNPMQANKISIWQAVILLFLCRMFSVLTYTPGISAAVGGTEQLIANLLSAALQFVLLIPAYLIYRMDCGRNIITAAKEAFHQWSLPISLLYYLFLLLIAVNTMTQFTFFMTNAVFPQASRIFFVLTMLLVVLYAMHAGLEAISRTSVLIFAGFLVMLFFVIFASIPQMELVNLKPALSHAGTDIVRATIENFARNSELVVLLLIFPKVKGGIRKGVITLLIGITVAFELIGFTMTTVLGDYAGVQSFPFYALASLAEASVFQRLDALHMAIWVFISFLKISLYLYLAADVLKSMLTLRFAKAAAPTSVILFLTASLITVFGIEWLRNMSFVLTTAIPVGVLVFLIPLLLVIVLKWKKGRAKENGVVSQNTPQAVVETHSH